MREQPLFIGPAELEEIRRNADWREVFLALGIERVKRPGNAHDWWALSPFRSETRASFHMNDHGFYCFPDGPGGGVIELVQAVRAVNCYEAGRWLVENGLSRCGGGEGPRPALPAAAAISPKPQEKAPHRNVSGYGTEPAAESEPVCNRPVRQNLVPLLRPEHAELGRRGITPATCAYLGCGYLPEGGKSPLSGRIVFQVRGVRDGRPVILSHIGRALTDAQAEAGGKWHHYRGFLKTQELYNLDKLVLDPQAAAAAQAAGQILLVEGCFDVAQLVEAGILNAGATFGAHLDPDQLPRLEEIAAATGVGHFRVFYDRDAAGQSGQAAAVALINGSGTLTATGFDWKVAFPSPTRGSVAIPEAITDPGDFSPAQLQFLRQQRAL